MDNQQQGKDISASSPYVAVLSNSFSKSSLLRKEMKRIFPNSFFNESGGPFPEKELINFLKDADAAVVGVESITDKVLSHASRLKIISKYGVGLDSIDQESMKHRKITLGWTGGVNRRSVSELALCFMLGLSRNIFGSGFGLKKKQWEKEGGQQLTGKTIGIIGCGHIGSDLIQLLAPLQCVLLVNDVINKSKFCREHFATQTELENLIEKSDIVSLHVPLTSLTNKMVDNNFLRRMKPTAYLINTCRGGVIDQEALKTALMENNIAGAALDVFVNEPPTDEEFLCLPNLMVTPHIGGNAKEAIEAMGKSAINHLVAYFSDHPVK